MATTVTSSTKKKTVRMNGCVASAQAAKYADVDVIAAYPIRPYTATMMALAQMVANGELDAEYIVADSEHSQLSIAHGAASSGARVFTGSSGVGVHYAYELYSPISGSRMPVQMMIADRTLDPPGDFGSEHTDALATRDMGWLMGWSCDAQEAFDNHLMAYRIGEDPRVLLPQMVCQDGFFFVQGGGAVALRYAIRHMRGRGAKVGMVRLRTIRPYPTDRVMETLSKFKVVGVVETNMGLGSVSSGGSLYAEAVAALYESPQHPLVISFMAGMGGEAIVLKEFYWMTKKMTEAQRRGKIEKRTHWVGFEE